MDGDHNTDAGWFPTQNLLVRKDVYPLFFTHTRDFTIYCVIKSHADEFDYSQKQIADLLSLCRKSVRRSITLLIKNGLIYPARCRANLSEVYKAVPEKAVKEIIWNKINQAYGQSTNIGQFDNKSTKGEASGPTPPERGEASGPTPPDNKMQSCLSGASGPTLKCLSGARDPRGWGERPQGGGASGPTIENKEKNNEKTNNKSSSSGRACALITDAESDSAKTTTVKFDEDEMIGLPKKDPRQLVNFLADAIPGDRAHVKRDGTLAKAKWGYATTEREINAITEDVRLALHRAPNYDPELSEVWSEAETIRDVIHGADRAVKASNRAYAIVLKCLVERWGYDRHDIRAKVVERIPAGRREFKSSSSPKRFVDFVLKNCERNFAYNPNRR